MSNSTTPTRATIVLQGWQASVQRVGGYLAAMVMPNIGAFIAWGLITALFVPSGWFPNESLAQMVGPMITVLLPVLIGFTGGRLVHGERGGVIAAIAMMGIVVGSDIPHFLGAMTIGPLSAYLLKRVDEFLRPRIRVGFEMLANNTALVVLGVAMAILGFLVIGPVVTIITTALASGADYLVSNRLLPVASVIVEPAKVLFLNNAVNHGFLAPLGVIEAQTTGKSILFMIETNPGPGLGILAAFWLAGPRAVRPTVPGAAVIHFLGGIHEVYFPYVLMKPRLIIAAIAGGATGVATFMVTGSGLVATPSPGSIFAWVAVTPRGGFFGSLAGVVLSALVSGLLGFVLLKAERQDRTPQTTETTETADADSAKA